MKPLKLVFEGIRSFSEKTVIDFKPLTATGLFGIFGSTGSGKSTILDAIIIALYGGLSGLNMSEIISTRRNKASVCFEFSISDKGNRKNYQGKRKGQIHIFEREKSVHNQNWKNSYNGKKHHWGI